jgi:hypothetical protein
VARHRDIAASPVRTAAETWTAISNLIASTLDRSPNFSSAHVAAHVESAAPAGRALVAAGYLDRSNLTLIAGPLRLTIKTVSGETAFRALEDENPNPVPGAATCDAWMLYLPTPPGLATLVTEVAAEAEHISSDDPPSDVDATDTKAAAVIDLRRLDPTLRS